MNSDISFIYKHENVKGEKVNHNKVIAGMK